MTKHEQLDSLPNIKKAALLIAYDNGMINRDSSEELFLCGVDDLLGDDGMYHEDLVKEDAFIGTLTEDELEVVCCGDQDEAATILGKAPPDRIGPDLLPMGEAVQGLLLMIFERHE